MRVLTGCFRLVGVTVITAGVGCGAVATVVGLGGNNVVVVVDVPLFVVPGDAVGLVRVDVGVPWRRQGQKGRRMRSRAVKNKSPTLNR